MPAFAGMAKWIGPLAESMHLVKKLNHWRCHRHWLLARQEEEFPMRIVSIAAAAALLATPIVAPAHLPVGASAPDFTTQGAIGGKVFTVKLRDALRKGPVVLYFYPAAFTPGCTAEAHEFAEATEQFRKAGATVLGMSADPIDKLQKFSVQECRNKFAVATAQPAVIKAYDVAMSAASLNRPGITLTPEQLAQLAARTDRTSFVIAPNGKIIFVHSDLSYKEHVAKTLAAVQQWKAARGKKG
jgi:peroxiredoxin